MAIMIAGAGAAYLNGGLGKWEFVFHHHSYMVRIQRASILRVHWRWLDITYRLGHPASPLRKSHRPVRANLFLGLRQFVDPGNRRMVFWQAPLPCIDLFHLKGTLQKLANQERQRIERSEAISDGGVSARRLFEARHRQSHSAEQLNEARLPRNCGQGDGRLTRGGWLEYGFAER